jgi:hypothetical protein
LAVSSFQIKRSLLGASSPGGGLILPLVASHIVCMAQWKSAREPKKTKAELYEMLAQAVRNTQPRPKRPPRPSRLKAADLIPECKNSGWPTSPGPHQPEFRHNGPGTPPALGPFSVRISGHTQKPPRFPSTARAVAFYVEVALRRAVLERGASSCLDAQPQLGGWCVASVSGQRSPTFVMCDWGRCPSSQCGCPIRLHAPAMLVRRSGH